MDYLQYIKQKTNVDLFKEGVLNLIINGLPSILKLNFSSFFTFYIVLNLIINGLPSILVNVYSYHYKVLVLNLIINGLPSIHLRASTLPFLKIGF